MHENLQQFTLKYHYLQEYSEPITSFITQRVISKAIGCFITEIPQWPLPMNQTLDVMLVYNIYACITKKR